jgi:ferredoxin
VLYDEFLGEKLPEPASDDYPDIAEFEKLPAEARWRQLTEELSRCIRCYACRAVCPNCYCPTCFVDASQPGWVGRTNDESDNVMFHIMRAMHMAGRCVECGACARACPMDIDLMRLNRKVARIVRERFNHVSGMNLDDPLPMTTFSPDDAQEFII